MTPERRAELIRLIILQRAVRENNNRQFTDTPIVMTIDATVDDEDTPAQQAIYEFEGAVQKAREDAVKKHIQGINEHMIGLVKKLQSLKRFRADEDVEIDDLVKETKRMRTTLNTMCEDVIDHEVVESDTDYNEEEIEFDVTK